MVPHGVQWVARLTPSGCADRGADAGDDAVQWTGSASRCSRRGARSPRYARCAGSASPDDFSCAQQVFQLAHLFDVVPDPGAGPVIGKAPPGSTLLTGRQQRQSGAGVHHA